jgi:peptide/nickel transport system substrate-binding protein
MQALGITINVQGTDSLGKTLTQADSNHTFDIIVFAWVDTPYWDTGNAQLYMSNPGTTVLGGNYGFYTSAKVDSLLQDASTNLDLTKAADEENQADAILSHDAVTLPLFQKDSMIAFNANLVGVRDNITSSGPTYNLQEWGFSANASVQ